MVCIYLYDYVVFHDHFRHSSWHRWKADTRELCAKKICFNEWNESGWCAFHPRLVSYMDSQNFRERLIALRTFCDALRTQILSRSKGWREENASSWPPLQPPVASGLLDTPRAFIENSNHSSQIQISLWNVFCDHVSLTLWVVQFGTKDCAWLKSFLGLPAKIWCEEIGRSFHFVEQIEWENCAEKSNWTKVSIYYFKIEP